MRSEGRREQGRQGNFKGCTLRRIFLRFLVLQMKNSELVCKLCIVMRRNGLVDRWMTQFYVMAVMDWVHMAWTWCIVGLDGKRHLVICMRSRARIRDLVWQYIILSVYLRQKICLCTNMLLRLQNLQRTKLTEVTQT